jgi:class 3 adenylate cyclase
MAVDRVQRRMAAILAADVVGYSRLMGKDEEGTLATLKLYREIIDDLMAHHEGRVFGSAGDSVIAEFASPVEAVRCATEIQLEIDKRNADLPEPNRMRFRIGINLGDIVVDGGNLMGDGVNVAARLETLSPPGGICVSESIHAQVRDRLSLDFLDLGEHKVKNIARPVHAYRVPLPSEEQVRSPFRGLDAFDFEHADRFFGRSHAIATCAERLEQLAASGKAFLLIYGMSGSGKSSLLRAGLLPAITRRDAVAGITLWQRSIIRPSEAPDAIVSLAAGLVREGALPELTQDKSPTELAELFRSTPDRALSLVRSALAKAAAANGSSPSQARLVLAVDQLEELFTTDTDPSSREEFVRLLAALASSGLVWMIGTIRADFFHRCGEIPGFSALKDGLSSYELLPPNRAEIAQIIREPARAAGLRFEEDPDRGRLDDVLQDSLIAVLKGHQGVVEGAIFSPDGSRVLTSARDATVRVWDAASGKLMFVLHQPGAVHTALFSPGGTRILTASVTADPTIWDTQTGQQNYEGAEFGDMGGDLQSRRSKLCDGPNIRQHRSDLEYQRWQADQYST